MDIFGKILYLSTWRARAKFQIDFRSVCDLLYQFWSCCLQHFHIKQNRENVLAYSFLHSCSSVLCNWISFPIFFSDKLWVLKAYTCLPRGHVPKLWGCIVKLHHERKNDMFFLQIFVACIDQNGETNPSLNANCILTRYLTKTGRTRVSIFTWQSSCTIGKTDGKHLNMLGGGVFRLPSLAGLAHHLFFQNV